MSWPRGVPSRSSRLVSNIEKPATCTGRSPMRVLCVRVLCASMLMLLAGVTRPAFAQQSNQRAAVRPMVDTEIRTRVERLLATPDTLLATDYYHIDMRFGPDVRFDAVIVTAVESRARMQGLRVQVRDDDKTRQIEGTTYLDLDEID